MSRERLSFPDFFACSFWLETYFMIKILNRNTICLIEEFIPH